MPCGRQLAPLAVGDADCARLQGVANSITGPHALVPRARMILADGEGVTKAAGAVRGFGEVGRKVTQALSRRCIRRLHDESRLDRAETFRDENVDRVIKRASVGHVCQRHPVGRRKHGRGRGSLG